MRGAIFPGKHHCLHLPLGTPGVLWLGVWWLCAVPHLEVCVRQAVLLLGSGLAAALAAHWVRAHQALHRRQRCSQQGRWEEQRQ